MTETDLTTAAQASAPATRRRGEGLAAMVLPELRALAGKLGIKGTSGMRKGDLIAAIQATQGGSEKPRRTEAAETAKPEPVETPAAGEDSRRARERSDGRRDAVEQADRAPRTESAGEPSDQGERQGRGRQEQRGQQDQQGERQSRRRNRRGREQQQDGGRDQQQDGGRDQQGNRGKQQDGRDQQGDRGPQGSRGQQQQSGRDEDGDGRGRRSRRTRDRRGRGRGGDGIDTEIREGDVLSPVAGILDVLDNYAFVRTSGYLAGQNDVYVSMNMVRRHGLRRGDAITGAVRMPRDGEGQQQTGGQSRQKFNPLVRIDTVNGGPLDEAANRPEFAKLTPLYPNQRLRLETTPNILTTRVIDLIMPIGKGQRALIVSPPKAGKTTILQNIANAIATNNPECHLMVVLVDERPEEVTDMQRSVRGEVIASTFDRPPSDHTAVSELAIERAKRLVEQGRDVVVLLDSITRLGRAYNNSSPASGRILSGGVDSTALYPPKRFLGAARNIENGGSLTIIATAMVETGSAGDTVIFEEFKGTGNAELKLDRRIAERRVFPAVDVNPSGTRKDELLLGSDEAQIMHKLRRVLSGLDPHQAIDLLIAQLKKTKSNRDFLVQVAKTTPGAVGED